MSALYRMVNGKRLQKVFCGLKLSVFLILPFLFGCSEEDDYVTYMEFTSIIEREAGDNAIFCGEVKNRTSPTEVNMCVSESFNNNQSFLAIYELLGIESQSVMAVTMSPQGTVTIWRYNGVDEVAEQVKSTICENPDPKDDLTVLYESPFSCSNLDL